MRLNRQHGRGGAQLQCGFRCGVLEAGVVAAASDSYHLYFCFFYVLPCRGPMVPCQHSSETPCPDDSNGLLAYTFSFMCLQLNGQMKSADMYKRAMLKALQDIH